MDCLLFSLYFHLNSFQQNETNQLSLGLLHSVFLYEYVISLIFVQISLPLGLKWGLYFFFGHQIALPLPIWELLVLSNSNSLYFYRKFVENLGLSSSVHLQGVVRSKTFQEWSEILSTFGLFGIYFLAMAHYTILNSIHLGFGKNSNSSLDFKIEALLEIYLDFSY